MIIALPDDASPAEIAEIVGDYYRPAKPQEGPPSPEAIDSSRDCARCAPGLQTPSDMPSDPAPDPASAETRPPRVRIEAIERPNDPGNVRYPHPVDYPTGVDPADPFRDNWHANWRRR